MKFEKVSYAEFRNSIKFTDSEVFIRQCYDALQLPTRSTKGSAGYDFRAPYGFTLNPGDTIKIPTGIKAQIDNGYVLLLFARSSVGTKYKTTLDNGTGVVDEDYYNNESNEGHMFAQFTNHGDKPWVVNQGDKYMQGIFVKYGITDDDAADGIRTGGFGSTGN